MKKALMLVFTLAAGCDNLTATDQAFEQCLASNHLPMDGESHVESQQRYAMSFPQDDGSTTIVKFHPIYKIMPENPKEMKKVNAQTLDAVQDIVFQCAQQPSP